MSEEVRKHIEEAKQEIREEIRAGNRSLHSRHDNHDQSLGALHRLGRRVVAMMAAALRFDGKRFMEAWKDRDHEPPPD